MLWSRTQLATGVPVQFGIADFAPDHGVLSLVPEPSTWMMMLLGFGAIGFAMRRSRAPRNVLQLRIGNWESKATVTCTRERRFLQTIPIFSV